MDTVFFWLSKSLWFLLSPLNFILLCLTLVWLLWLLNIRKYLKSLATALLLVLYAMAIFPLGSSMLHPLENRFQTNPPLPQEVEGIIVLSGSISADKSKLWNQTEVNAAVDRELAFIKLARRYPHAALVYSGGSSNLLAQENKAADVARRLFSELGFNPERITFERESRNTWENARLTFQNVQPELKRPWILITSAFHMPRSVGVFCKTGWPVIPYPVDHYSSPEPSFKPGFSLAGRSGILDMAVHEWLGLLAYRLTGKTDALLPDTCSD